LTFIDEKKYQEIISLINLSKFADALNLLKNFEKIYDSDIVFNNLDATKPEKCAISTIK
jgi:hypothetical protein